MRLLSVIITSICFACLPAATPAAEDAPEPLVLWNGESADVGVGWTVRKKLMSIEAVTDEDAHSGDQAIVARFSHPEIFCGWGWQWFKWFPKPEGTDIRPYSTLHIALKVEGPRPPNELMLSLASPGDHHTTQRLKLKQRVPDLFASEWHAIELPREDFYTADMKFDPEHTIQVIMGTWNEDGDFAVWMDDISLR